jgi:hypothetical protein
LKLKVFNTSIFPNLDFVLEMSVVKMFCSLLFPQAERVLVAGDIKHEIKKQMLNGSA